MKKPRLFIASSSEGLEIAYATQENLEPYAEVTVWTQGIFDLSEFTLQSLLKSLEVSDCGLFIFTPDDITTMRDQTYSSVRDNIIFELGLFIGHLGRERSFILIPHGVANLLIPSDLMGLTIAEFDPNRRDKNLTAALGPACYKVKRRLQTCLPKLRDNDSPPLVTLLPRSDFTKLLLQKLSDENVHKVQIITYTSEVDAGVFDRYHIRGTKSIEVYKRSILSDLAEQQECNLNRLLSKHSTRLWQKREKSIAASEHLEKEIPPGTQLVQYFHHSAPSKRAYVFDDSEAIVAFYEVVEDPLKGDGSVYQGMETTDNAIWVTRHSPLGAFLLDDIKNYINGLRRTSRSWKEEREILLERGAWRGVGRRPCVTPKAVFLDSDGVLYDSLPFYVKAWQDAFLPEGIDFPERKVYLEEGRRSRDTILRFMESIGRSIDEATLERIQARKTQIFNNIWYPKPQEGAKDLLRAIASSSLQIWVVTGASNGPNTVQLAETFAPWVQAENIITGDDVHASKPDPEPYLLACTKANVHPHEAIVIENAPLGIRAADAAGTFCIAVNTGKLSDSELKQEEARAVFRSCSKLAEKWDDVLAILRI